MSDTTKKILISCAAFALFVLAQMQIADILEPYMGIFSLLIIIPLAFLVGWHVPTVADAMMRPKQQESHKQYPSWGETMEYFKIYVDTMMKSRKSDSMEITMDDGIIRYKIDVKCQPMPQGKVVKFPIKRR